MAEERMSTTSVQLNAGQFSALSKIRKKIDASSNAEVLRKAFDFYVKKEHPEFIQK
jgi:hypothetical protein